MMMPSCNYMDTVPENGNSLLSLALRSLGEGVYPACLPAGR